MEILVKGYSIMPCSFGNFPHSYLFHRFAFIYLTKCIDKMLSCNFCQIWSFFHLFSFIRLHFILMCLLITVISTVTIELYYTCSLITIQGGFIMRWYRDNWFYVGGILFIIQAFLMILWGGDMDFLRKLMKTWHLI